MRTVRDEHPHIFRQNVYYPLHVGGWDRERPPGFSPVLRCSQPADGAAGVRR